MAKRKKRSQESETRPASAESLLACLKGQEPGDRQVDWPSVAELARRHSLEPLLYHRLEREQKLSRVPAPEREQLRKAYYLNADRNIRRYHQLQPVLAALRDRGIPVILLKGACLAEIVYRNIALRPMRDVDLLVPKTELARARTALLEYGCAHKPDDIDTFTRISHQLGVFVIPDPDRAGASPAR